VDVDEGIDALLTVLDDAGLLVTEKSSL